MFTRWRRDVVVVDGGGRVFSLSLFLSICPFLCISLGRRTVTRNSRCFVSRSENSRFALSVAFLSVVYFRASLFSLFLFLLLPSSFHFVGAHEIKRPRVCRYARINLLERSIRRTRRRSGSRRGSRVRVARFHLGEMKSWLIDIAILSGEDDTIVTSCSLPVDETVFLGHVATRSNI